ncbi:MAG: type II toxin-antitoxin system RelE/ParE family toxin [Oscillospiraceae bacterium]|nr:type II toxin-antitoxin system RelE/ParE family toxin [Oscillospiraceae bacterium]
MYKVNYSEPAENDLKSAAAYIAGNLRNKIAAANLLDAADRAVLSLSDFPERNPLVRDALLAANGFRMQRINNYLAFYVIDSETQTVSILRVIHSRRDWMSILKDDLEGKQ